MVKIEDTAPIEPIVGEESPEELALFGLLRSLEASLAQESDSGLLTPFIREIYALLSAGHFAEALPLVDELEEFMDLELCEKKSPPYS